MTSSNVAIRDGDARYPGAASSSSADALAKHTTIALRLFEESDRAELYAVYEEAFGAEALARFDRRWRWQFVENPAAALAPRMLWVGELDGRVVGCLSSHLSRLKLGDRELPHRFSNDLAVSTAARGWGLGTRLIGAYFHSVEHLATGLYFTPTNRRIHDRLGYRPVEIYPMLVRPVHARAMLQFELSSGRFPERFSRKPAARLVAAGAVAADAVVAGMNRVLFPPRSPRYRVGVAEAATDEFTALWRSLRDAFVITTVRDRAFVQWRFFDDPAFAHTVLVARDRAGNLGGYLGLCISENRGMRVGRIVDLFCPPHDLEMVDALVREALGRLESVGVDVVCSLGMDPRLRRRLGRYLYLRPPGRQAPVLVAWRERERDSPMVYDSRSYHFTGADGDQWFAP